tara:strand:+ start:559 stop:939 length:381 start_codon:yes stop_codon:yes gene_type:complete
MKVASVKIASSFLILMFVISGISKVVTLGKSESERLSKKLMNIDLKLSQFIVFSAGLWELIGSALILYGIWNFNSNYLHFGSLMLVIFTIMATLIFYVFPFKHLPFLSNLTTASALFLLPFICVKC